MSKNTSLLFATLLMPAILQVGCSNSSGGGGVTNAKPNLNPAKNVSLSISVIQLAGRAQGTGLLSIPPINEEKARSVELRKMISNPGDCQVKFSESLPPQSGNPPSDMNLGSWLKIAGQNCPLVANFTSQLKAEMLKTSVTVDYSFHVVDKQAQDIVGASDGEIHGQGQFGPLQDGSGYSGDGKFTGYINSLQYGTVSLEMIQNQAIKVGPSGTTQGYITEILSLQFPYSKLNLKLIKGITITGSSETTICTANGVTITEEEYNSILNDVGAIGTRNAKQPHAE